MKTSELFFATLREDPAEAEVVSHKLLLRAGFIKKLAAGIYSFMPLGWRVMSKLTNIIRDEMNTAGAQEVFLPAIQPAELWQESKRWDIYGKELLRIKDRHDREFVFGPTAEEVITDLVRDNIRSYKQLPVNLYQIQTKFRDEIRPRFGLMRGREFMMKDAYSFHADESDLDREYKNMYETYNRIFKRCGLEFRAVEADPGAIGGSSSQEFMVLADSGEDQIVHCTECDYAASREIASVGESKDKKLNIKNNDGHEIEKVKTPNMRTVEEVTAFLKAKPSQLIKTLIYNFKGKPLAVLVRGDHNVSEAKLRKFLGEGFLELADEATIKKVTGAPVGFAGPVGLKNIKIFADHSVANITDGISGANEADMHIKNVAYGRDFKADKLIDVRYAETNDICPKCLDARIELRHGIEVGHVFKLGTKYSETMQATFLDDKGKSNAFIMGCYGIGLGRTMAAAIEQNNDKDGIIWPLPLAPFAVAVVPVRYDDESQKKVAQELYEGLKSKNIEVLLDDRMENVGVKLKDIDLIGIPIKVVVGPKGLKEGNVEIKTRKDGAMIPAKIEDAIAQIEGLLNSGKL
ncbi:MAG: proline--tRNA ligase [bacterium]